VALRHRLLDLAVCVDGGILPSAEQVHRNPVAGINEHRCDLILCFSQVKQLVYDVPNGFAFVRAEARAAAVLDDVSQFPSVRLTESQDLLLFLGLLGRIELSHDLISDGVDIGQLIT